MMKLDDKVCYCFHVTRRKIENYVRHTQPRVVSQLSECGGAGTGCGWCIPFLRQIFEQSRRVEQLELDRISPEEYAQRRASYIRETKPTTATDDAAESSGSA